MKVTVKQIVAGKPVVETLDRMTNEAGEAGRLWLTVSARFVQIHRQPPGAAEGQEITTHAFLTDHFASAEFLPGALN